MMHVADFDRLKGPGDFFFTDADEYGMRRLSFYCPCGCGLLAGIKVRIDGLAVDGTWTWNTDEDNPTCTPSIAIMVTGNMYHWHGYLTNGEFVPC